MPFTKDDLDRLVDAYSNNTFTAWRPDYNHATIMAATSPTPVFCAAAPDVMDLPDQDTFLWRYLYTALRSYYSNPAYIWKPQYQKSGTCVGQAAKLAQDTIAAVNSLLYGIPFPGRFSVAAVYAGSRVEIGKQPGAWEGSSGSWAADWSVRYGCVLLKSLNLADEAKDEDEQLALRWTRSRDGVPAEYESLARQRPILHASLCLTAREAGKAIQNGNVVTNASTLIPTGKRDQFGFSPVRRSGGHQTLFWGVRYNPFGLLYQNSWSELWSPPENGGRYPDDQPPGSVWVTEDDANAILAQRDSYVYVGMGGLHPRRPHQGLNLL